MMWLILLIASIIFFLVSGAYAQFYQLWLYGVILALLGTAIEYFGQIKFRFWKTKQRIAIFKLPLFLFLTYFFAGMLIIYFLPISIVNQIIYIIVLIIATILLEYCIIKLGYVKWYKHYPYLCIAIHTIVIALLVVISRIM